VAFRIHAFGISDPGQVRARNEDAMAVEPTRGLLVVADGMGGAPAGEVASAVAVQEVARGLHAGETMEVVLLGAHDRLREMAADKPHLAGMGTTVTALVVDGDGGTFVLGHVGDSRAYHLSGGILYLRTTDHTLVRSMVEEGRLPPEAEKDHPMAHILTRALGVEEEVEPEIIRGVVSGGDRFLLCSDGLGRVMSEDEVGEWIRALRSTGLEEAASSLIEEANRRGAPDNVTVAALTVD
jgi:protein phosphatase